jgi:hypothetical protein
MHSQFHSVLVVMLPRHRSHRLCPDVDLVESALLSAATGPSVDTQHAASHWWEVGKLLDYLKRNGSDLRERARLEFLLTNLLQHTRPARALDEALQADPPIFAEILSCEGFYDGLAAGRGILQAFEHGLSRLQLVEECVADDEVILFRRHPASGRSRM